MTDVDKIHLRHCILYEFQKGNSATTASRNLCEVFGKNIITERTCQRWFNRFRSGKLNLEDEPRSGRPSNVDETKLRSLIEADPNQTSRRIADEIGVHQTNVLKHIHRLGLKHFSQRKKKK